MSHELLDGSSPQFQMYAHETGFPRARRIVVPLIKEDRRPDVKPSLPLSRSKNAQTVLKSTDPQPTISINSRQVIVRQFSNKGSYETTSSTNPLHRILTGITKRVIRTQR